MGGYDYKAEFEARRRFEASADASGPLGADGASYGVALVDAAERCYEAAEATLTADGHRGFARQVAETLLVYAVLRLPLVQGQSTDGILVIPNKYRDEVVSYVERLEAEDEARERAGIPKA